MASRSFTVSQPIRLSELARQVLNALRQSRGICRCFNCTMPHYSRALIASLASRCSEEIPDLLSGNCAVFAAALARTLGDDSTVRYVEDREQPDFICHAAVLYRGRLYDGNGSTSMENMQYWCDTPCNAVFFTDDPNDDEVIRYLQRTTASPLSFSEILPMVQDIAAQVLSGNNIVRTAKH